MPSPFPGMDPYLEAPEVWPDLHGRLAFALSEQLQPVLLPKYAALVPHAIELERVSPAGQGEGVRSSGEANVAVVRAKSRRSRARPPSGGSLVTTRVAAAPQVLPLPRMQEVRHYWIEVRLAAREPRRRRLVAAIEIVSRANKLPGRDRRAYERKREAYLASDAHFIEIDLLRAGRRWKVADQETWAAYRILVSRAERDRVAQVWPLSLRDSLPTVPLPLLPPDSDATLDLRAALARAYEGGPYRGLVEYREPPPPPRFSPDDVAWIDALLAPIRASRWPSPSPSHGGACLRQSRVIGEGVSVDGYCRAWAAYASTAAR